MQRWAEHCADAFPEGPEYFLNHYQWDPWRRAQGIFVAEDAGEIVSTARVFMRKVYLEGQAVPMGGIGEVSTKMDYRKQGLSARLVDMAVDYMRREGLPISFLFAGYYSHYEKRGYRQVPSRCKRVTMRCDDLPGDVTLRPVTEQDLQEVADIYAGWAPQFNGSLVRDSRDYWRDWVLPQAGDWVAAQVDGKVQAYIMCQTAVDPEHGLTVCINEMAALPGCEDLLPGMVKARCRELEAAQARFYAPMADKLPKGCYKLVKDEQYTALMVRCNQAFYAGGRPITDTRTLAALLAGHAFCPVDGF